MNGLIPRRVLSGRVLRTVILAGLLLLIAVASVNRETILMQMAARLGAMETYAMASSDSAVPQGPSAYVAVARWNKNPVTYSISNCPSTLDCAAAHQAVRDAVEAWDAASGLTLDEVSGAVGDIDISWQRRAHGDGNPFDGPGRVLAHAYYPVEWLGPLAGDVHLDDEEAWVVGTPAARMEIHLGTTVMHEVGHALGLDHSNEPSALMWNEYTGVRGLAPDDTAGIQSLYGTPEPASIPPAPAGVTATANTNLRIRTGPATTFQQVGIVPSGTTIPVLGKNAAGDWLYIDSNGMRGWVAGWYATVNGDLNTVPVVANDGSGAPGTPPANPPSNPPTSPPPGNPPSDPPTGVTATTRDYARMRSGPGTTYSQVETIPYNATVSVLGRNTVGDWIKVEYNGIQGWVASWLLTVHGDINSLPVLG